MFYTMQVFRDTRNGSKTNVRCCERTGGIIRGMISMENVNAHGAGGIKFSDEVTGELEIRGVRTL